MTKGYTKEVIEEYLYSWEGYESKIIKRKGDSFNSIFEHRGKKIHLESPYEVGEFYLNFEEKGEVVFSDWYEIMDDPVDEFMEFTKSVIDKFLFRETRIIRKGMIFKNYNLEVKIDGKWENVYGTITRPSKRPLTAALESRRYAS